MGKKKSSSMGILYLIGMILVVIGFICPIRAGRIFSWELNGFSMIDFKDFGAVTIAALLILIGGVLGIVAYFLNGKNIDMLKLIAIILIAAGVIILVVSGLTNTNSKSFNEYANKSFLKRFSYGFYMIIVGDILAAVGKFLK